LAENQLNSMLKTRTCLEPIRNSLQKPIESLPAKLAAELYEETANKGTIDFSTH
jgi:hypothetical protein